MNQWHKCQRLVWSTSEKRKEQYLFPSIEVKLNQESFGFGSFLFYSCSLLMKIGNHCLIHLASVQAVLSDGKVSGGISLQSCRDHLGLVVMKPLPGQTCSSHLWSFLCNPRSKVPGRREWILRSNKHTFSDGRNWTHFSLSYSCRLARSLSLKDIPRHDSEGIIPSAEHARR